MPLQILGEHDRGNSCGPESFAPERTDESERVHRTFSETTDAPGIEDQTLHVFRPHANERAVVSGAAVLRYTRLQQRAPVCVA